MVKLKPVSPHSCIWAGRPKDCTVAAIVLLQDRTGGLFFLVFIAVTEPDKHSDKGVAILLLFWRIENGLHVQSSYGSDIICHTPYLLFYI